MLLCYLCCYWEGLADLLVLPPVAVVVEVDKFLTWVLDGFLTVTTPVLEMTLPWRAIFSPILPGCWAAKRT